MQLNCNMLRLRKGDEMKRMRLFLGFCALAVAGPAVCGTEMRTAIMADSYIESDGSQYVDLGFAPKKTSRFELEYSVQSSASDKYLLGAFDPGVSPYKYKCGLYFQKLSTATTVTQKATIGNEWNESGSWLGSDIEVRNERFTASLDLATGKFSLTSIGVATTKTGNALTNDMATTLMLFSANTPYGPNRDVGSAAIARIYWFKAYEGSVLTMDLIPYSRDGKVGFLDRLSGRIFTAGHISGDRPLKFGTDDAYVVSSASEQAGLNTGYLANPKTKVEIDFALRVRDAWKRLFGNDDAGDFRCGLYTNSKDANYALCFKFGDEGTAAYGLGIRPTGERRVFTIDGPGGQATMKKLTVGDVWVDEKTQELDPTRASKTATVAMAIFAQSTKVDSKINNSGYADMRLYGMRIWDNGTLIHDYRPKMVDGVAALYDEAEGQKKVLKPVTYTHDALTPGGNIPIVSTTGATPVHDAYLEGKNGPVINTGLLANGTWKVENDYVYLHNETNFTHNMWGANSSGKGGLTRFYQYMQSNVNGGSTKHAWAVTTEVGGTTTQKWPNFGVFDVMKRFTAGCNLPTGKISMSGQADGSIGVTPAATLTNTYPFAIFSFCNNAAGTSFSTKARMRLYELKISESGTLTHDYVPAGFAGEFGLYDRKTGDFKKNVGTGSFTLGGAGVGGAGMVFETQPQDAYVRIGESVTLSAFAPGAAGLQWLKDGEPVVGATGPKLEVEWNKSHQPAKYQCLAYYAIAGYALSDVATVENEPRGMVLIVK